MCVVLPRLSWQGRRCALPLHPSGCGADFGIEPVPHHRGECSLPNRSRAALPPPYPNPARIGCRQGCRAPNHDQGVCRPWTLHTGFAHRDDRRGVPAPWNPASPRGANRPPIGCLPMWIAAYMGRVLGDKIRPLIYSWRWHECRRSSRQPHQGGHGI